MGKKIVYRIMLILLLTAIAVFAFDTKLVKSGPTTIVVPDDYPTIQQAIDHAYSSYLLKEADTIYVREGTYYENIVVDMSKHYLTLVGENSLTTIIDGVDAGQPVVTIRDVILRNFSGFLVRNSGGEAPGIYVYNASCQISGSNIRDNYQGIQLYFAFSTNLTGNNIVSNTLGINVSYSPHPDCPNTIYHNNFIDNFLHAAAAEVSNTIWDDGYPSGGNYWDDYADVDLFSGLYQDELGSDGIWDHPYVFIDNNVDRYPFTQQDGWEAPPPPPPPPVPEFPPGLTLEILFIPVIIYVLWRSKQGKINRIKFGRCKYQAR